MFCRNRLHAMYSHPSALFPDQSVHTCTLQQFNLYLTLAFCFDFSHLLTAISLRGFLFAELTRGYLLGDGDEQYLERRERVYTFMKTPRELEKVGRSFFFFTHCSISNV